MEPCHSGQAFLKEYLGQNSFDLRHASPEQFAQWMRCEAQRRLEFDEVFIQKRQVRDLRLTHLDTLSRLQKAVDASTALYEESPHKARLDEIAYQQHCNQRALEGLSRALENTEQAALREKFQSFQDDQAALGREEAALIQGSPEYSNLQKDLAALQRFEESIGLPQENEKLQSLQRERGKNSGKSGQDFESFARNIVSARLGPLLSAPGETLHCLSGVTLGCARGELDFVLVCDRGKQQPVELRGIVEVKKNVNDIAESFLTRQENIAWFVGEEDHYDPEKYRTAVYRQGHFDKSAIHKEDGREWRFDKESFAFFKRDDKSGHYLHRLCFLTRLRPLLGASGGEQSRLIHSFATDFYADSESEDYLRELREWIREWHSDFQSRDVLSYYLDSPELAEQILFIGEEDQS